MKNDAVKKHTQKTHDFYNSIMLGLLYEKFCFNVQNVTFFQFILLTLTKYKKI